MARRTPRPSAPPQPRRRSWLNPDRAGRVELRLDEVVAAIAGRASHGRTAYREVPRPGDGRTVDVCAGCQVDCCSHHVIPLSVDDAYLIRRALNLPYPAFATLLPYPAGAPTWPVRIGRGRALLALRKRRHSCLFLLKLDGHRRCAIHGLRPMACRLFPFLPDAEAQRRAPVGMLAQRAPAECPWCWPRTGQAAAEVDQLIALNAQRLEVDRQVLRTWHRQLDLPHDRASFFAYLDEEMARRAGGETGPGRWRTSLW